jgi:hypothetical protein
VIARALARPSPRARACRHTCARDARFVSLRLDEPISQVPLTTLVVGCTLPVSRSANEEIPMTTAFTTTSHACAECGDTADGDGRFCSACIAQYTLRLLKLWHKREVRFDNH